VAILLALRHAEVVAFTTVFGNVDVSQATINVGLLCKLFGYSSIPIFPGASGPLVNLPTPPRWPGHGSNGLGSLTSSSSPANVKKIPAAVALVQLARARPQQLDLLCLGPLTNIALAIALDPAFLTLWKSVTVMGGAVGKGNSSHAAEFNFLSDPESAHVVFSRTTAPLTLCTWNLVESTNTSWGAFDGLFTSPALRDVMMHLTATYRGLEKSYIRLFYALFVRFGFFLLFMMHGLIYFPSHIFSRKLRWHGCRGGHLPQRSHQNRRSACLPHCDLFFS
jgi:hypothetical protein